MSQFLIHFAGYKCSEWGIHIPGGGVNCEAQSQSKRSCHAYCKANKTFMEDPGAASKPIECTEDENEGIWNRPPPVCGKFWQPVFSNINVKQLLKSLMTFEYSLAYATVIRFRFRREVL